MKKAEGFLKKHSSNILTFVGAAGVVATTVLAVKATPKALELIEEEREYRKDCTDIINNESYETVLVPDLTKLEMVKVAWKPYIPAAITGISTIACIFGINLLSTRSQASLMSAYAVLDNSFREYRNKVNELYGDKTDKNVKCEIAKDKYCNIEEDFEDEEGDSFFDFEGTRWFKSTVEKVKEAEQKFNELLSIHGYACLNDFYDILGVKRTDIGYQLGWSTITNDDIYGHYNFEVELEKTEMEGGMECWIMTMNCPPTPNFI